MNRVSTRCGDRALASFANHHGRVHVECELRSAGNVFWDDDHGRSPVLQEQCAQELQARSVRVSGGGLPLRFRGDGGAQQTPGVLQAGALAEGVCHGDGPRIGRLRTRIRAQVSESAFVFIWMV